MPAPNRLPLDLIDDYLELDFSTKYGLRWKKDIYRHIKKGSEAGYLKPGRVKGKEYAAVRLNRKVYYVHRIIYYLITKKDPESHLIDHIDGNTLNNHIENLRLVTNKENQRNRTVINKNNTSGCTGVTWDKNKRKWLAQISVNNKNKYLGRYETKEEAASAYNEAALIYFGEFKPVRKIIYST
jgi:hypothetical protein